MVQLISQTSALFHLINNDVIPKAFPLCAIFPFHAVKPGGPLWQVVGFIAAMKAFLSFFDLGLCSLKDIFIYLYIKLIDVVRMEKGVGVIAQITGDFKGFIIIKHDCSCGFLFVLQIIKKVIVGVVDIHSNKLFSFIKGCTVDQWVTATSQQSGNRFDP